MAEYLSETFLVKVTSAPPAPPETIAAKAGKSKFCFREKLKINTRPEIAKIKAINLITVNFSAKNAVPKIKVTIVKAA